MADLFEESEVATVQAPVFSKNDIDCYEENGNIWFCLSDVAKVLDIADSSVRSMKTRNWFDDDEVNTVAICNGNKGNPNKTYISESALYRILNRSNSPKAKPFERWVTKEVLPTLRKTGSYNVQKKEEPLVVASLPEKEVRMRTAELIERLADKYTGLSTTYKNAMYAHAYAEVTNDMCLLPENTIGKTYSATEVGQIVAEKLGYSKPISSQMIGRCANALNMKTEEFGKHFFDVVSKGKHECDTFRYNDKAVDRFVAQYDNWFANR